LSIWAEIKQRRITQIVLTYLAGGWMALAVVDQLVDRAVLPALAYRVGLTLYLFGFVVALILGWYHGEKGHQRAKPVEMVLVGIVSLVGLGMSARIVVTDLRATGEARRAQSLAAGSTMDLRRIGVLYFQDQSGDGSLAPVADALTEGLITALSEVRELNVVSRNGSESVRDLAVPPDSIASILQTGTLIEGGVRQSGGQLSVTVALLDGQSGAEIQRNTYNWPTDSLVSVQDRLADEVSKSLRTFLGQEIQVREGRRKAPSTAAWIQLARGQKSLRDASAALRHDDGQGAARAFQQADEDLAKAEAMDTTGTWTEPEVLRGQVAYESLPLAEGAGEAVSMLRKAVALADSALAVEPNNPAALELRGTAHYRRWLSRFDSDPDTLDRLLTGARADLEQAVKLDPGRASAYSTLSHLYYQVNEVALAVIAAQRAYEEDAFLTVADGVLWRLYSASYDLEAYDQAQRWCAEGYRRFPNNFRFAQCQLFLMTMTAAQPDVAKAWSLYQQLVPLLPEGQKTFLDAQAQTVVGGIIGRAGLPDSANAVMTRARLTPEQDPDAELTSIEAAMRALMGDKEGAIRLLQRYVVLNPGHFGGKEGLSWWWRSLQGDPEFERIRSMR
jgi:TolB-like protein/tetratricopeptide (TPR) repeat protein